jgi:NAD(P)H dehydrogenase (quinone)
MKKMLITGATGASTINNLLELKISVRVLVHRIDDRSKKLEAQGVEIIQGELSNFDVLNEALI